MARTLDTTDLDISVAGWSTSPEGHTQYDIVTTVPGGKSVTVSRRYSSFVALQESLKLEEAKLPGKAMMNTTTLKNGRVDKLNAYLNAAAAAESGPIDPAGPLAQHLGLEEDVLVAAMQKEMPRSTPPEPTPPQFGLGCITCARSPKKSG